MSDSSFQNEIDYEKSFNLNQKIKRESKCQNLAVLQKKTILNLTLKQDKTKKKFILIHPPQ